MKSVAAVVLRLYDCDLAVMPVRHRLADDCD